MHRVQYQYIHRTQVPKHTQAHQAHRLRWRAGLQAFWVAVRLPGRPRGRLPHQPPSLGQVPCSCLAAREVHARMRDAARVVPRY